MNAQAGGFEAAGKAVLDYLHQRFDFDLWMVTRREGDDWIVLQSEDNGYGVAPGRVFHWADSFCSEMVKGNGPNVAPESTHIPAYASAPIAREVCIRSYIGIPLVYADGSLFGTLCAIDPEPQPASIVDEQPLIELLGTLLSSVLQQELRAEAEQRRADRLAVQATTDALTGLYNRAGWQALLDKEEQRCRRYGNPAAVIVIDLDELKRVNDNEGHHAGDQLLRQTANALRQAGRGQDILARIGGDEFGVIGVECDQTGGETLLARLRDTLAAHGIQASAGLAMRDPSRGLNTAWGLADQRMYVEKHARRSGRQT